MSSIILQSHKIDSMAELIEGLKQSKSILLGKKAQQRKEFILLSIKNSNADAELLKIGVVCEGHGLKPQYMIKDSDEVIVGFNKEICLVSITSPNNALRKEFSSLFYEFKIIKDHNIVLVICETEVFCLNSELETIWSLCCDLIVDYEITDQYVKVITDEGAKIYSIFDGHII
jgi:hypothetical protein